MENARNPLLYIVTTVDVESSDNPDAICRDELMPIMTYGRIGQAYWGFPRILDMLSRYHLNATFFISALQYKKNGEAPWREICAEIIRKGQDIQLHIHPAWSYDKRFMAEYSYNEQVEIIRHGAGMLEKWTGEKPVAYRGGAFYSLNEDTFKALKSAGLEVDSTMFYGQPHCRYIITRNRVVEVDGIVELPVTFCRVQTDFSLGPLKYKRSPRNMKTDINAVGLDVLLQFVKEAKTSNIRVMNLFLHSYSFLHLDSSYRPVEPAHQVLEKFDRFLATVTGDPEIEVITVKRFHELYRRNPSVFTGASDHVPEIKTKLGTVPSLQMGWRYLKAFRL